VYSHDNKFKGEYCRELVDHFAEGKSLAEFLHAKKVVRSTFYNWLDLYPQTFGVAWKQAQLAGEAYWQNMMRHGAVTRDFNFRVAQFALSQRHGVTETRKLRHKDWLDVKDLTGSLNKLVQLFEHDGLSNEEMRAALDQLLAIATLKEKDELESRVAEIEDRLKI